MFVESDNKSFVNMVELNLYFGFQTQETFFFFFLLCLAVNSIIVQIYTEPWSLSVNLIAFTLLYFSGCIIRKYIFMPTIYGYPPLLTGGMTTGQSTEGKGKRGRRITVPCSRQKCGALPWLQSTRAPLPCNSTAMSTEPITFPIPPKQMHKQIKITA